MTRRLLCAVPPQNAVPVLEPCVPPCAPCGTERSKAAGKLLGSSHSNGLHPTHRSPHVLPRVSLFPATASRVTGAPFSLGCLTVLLAASSSEDAATRTSSGDPTAKRTTREQ